MRLPVNIKEVDEWHTRSLRTARWLIGVNAVMVVVNCVLLAIWISRLLG